MKRRMLWIAGVAAAVLLVGGVAVGGSDKDGPETATIDQIEGKKGAVEFKHKKHAKEYKTADGKEIKCVTCHHTSKGKAKIEACNTCHVAEGQPQKEHDGEKAPFLGTKKGSKVDMKSIIYHKNCLDGCHKKMAKADAKFKELGKCTNCHPKK